MELLRLHYRRQESCRRLSGWEALREPSIDYTLDIERDAVWKNNSGRPYHIDHTDPIEVLA